MALLSLKHLHGLTGWMKQLSAKILCMNTFATLISLRAVFTLYFQTCKNPATPHFHNLSREPHLKDANGLIQSHFENFYFFCLSASYNRRKPEGQ